MRFDFRISSCNNSSLITSDDDVSLILLLSGELEVVPKDVYEKKQHTIRKEHKRNLLGTPDFITK